MLSMSMKAQENLVPNGSFEDTVFCPVGINNPQALATWYNPTMASPDYYNSCANNGGGVPENEWGYQFAQDGKAYVGIILYANTSGPYREYVQVKLKSKLEKHQVYCWSAFISLLDSCDIATNNFSVGLSIDSVTDITSETILPMPIVFSHKNVVTDVTNWIKVERSFVAFGGEEFLTLGNFDQNIYTDSIIVAYNSAGGHLAYYYIDNVWLGKCPEVLELPNIFSPNMDAVNDFYSPIVSGVINYNWKIINRWGELVFSSDSNEQWNGTYNGQLCSEGIYFGIIEYENSLNEKKRKTGFIQLVR
jgi:gliding motility-associated-like protein